MSIPDPYAVLRIEPTATTAEIGQAYRHLMRQYHPDTRPDAHVGEEERSLDGALRLVMNAYSLLADPVSRAEYDRQHRQVDVKTDAVVYRGEGSAPGNGVPDPEAASQVYVEPAPFSDAVWLFPPAVHRTRTSHPVSVTYYLGVAL